MPEKDPLDFNLRGPIPLPSKAVPHLWNGLRRHTFKFLLLFIVSAATMFSALYFFKHPTGSAVADQKNDSLSHTALKKTTQNASFLFPLNNIEVPLRTETSSEKPPHLRIDLSLELQNARELDLVTLMMPKIKQQIKMYLSEMYVEDFSEGKHPLHMEGEILECITAVIKPLKPHSLTVANLKVF